MEPGAGPIEQPRPGAATPAVRRAGHRACHIHCPNHDCYGANDRNSADHDDGPVYFHRARTGATLIFPHTRVSTKGEASSITWR